MGNLAFYINNYLTDKWINKTKVDTIYKSNPIFYPTKIIIDSYNPLYNV